MRPVFALWLMLASTAVAAPSPIVEKAEAALREGMPQTAIAPLQEALRKAPASAKNELGLLLARAQLAAGRADDALKTLDGPCDRGSKEAVLLRAAVLASQGKLEQAAKLADQQAPDNPEASLLLARIRSEQGDLEAARALLPAPGTPLPADPNTLRLLLDLQLSGEDPSATESTISAARDQNLLPIPELDVALGRVLLAQNRPSDASETFRNVLATEELPAPVRDNARLGLARSLVILGVDARAREVLREGLGEAPDALTTRESMQQWIHLERKLGADPSADLRTWAQEKGTRRALEARLQLAQFDIGQKRPDAAIGVLYELAGDPELPANDALRARLLLAEARIAAGQTKEALESLDAIPAEKAGPASAYRLADLRGRALAANGAHRRAYDSFVSASNEASTPEEKTVAATNRLLTALAAEDLDLARQSFELLRETDPANPDLVRWSFLLATAEARQGKIDGLNALARRAPAADYAFQAKLALAEWRLARGEAEAAERILRTAENEADAEPRAAALAAAAIFAADNAGSQPREELVKACTEFLAAHADAPEAPDVAFKLGELHSRAGDHTAAESVLAGLAQNASDPEQAALAKFFAAQSAARSMSTEGAGRALAWFDEIAQSQSPLRHRARFEQASLLLRDRKFTDAITLYDRILAANPPQEVKHAALMEKADTLFALGTDDPSKFTEAAAVYAGLASETSAPADWRDQAACKRAAALAKAGQTEAALAAYREVLARPPGTSADHFWFYKAGLEAGRLLEEQKDWSAAIAVYDKLASAEGPQREDIKQRARRLRLEHFIWEN
jgi:thioredoxin-like negative regulator of GroEL